MRREDLYSHYERELLYLRRAGQGFAKAYPKVARRLALGPEQAGDPHVERLIESFAFLASRLQLNLDRQFPIFTDALLGILYPHMTAPVPSCGIARFETDLDAGQMTEGHVVPRGTELSAEAEDDVRCRFTTTDDVTMWPLTVDRTSVRQADGTLFRDGTVSTVLRIDLTAHGVPFEALQGLRRLRLFIHSEPTVAAAVYEALTTDVREAVFLSGDRSERDDGSERWSRAKRLSGQSVQPGGFDDGSNLFPTPANAHPAYALLQDYFVFPQKFLFVDVDIPDGALTGEEASICIGLSKPFPSRLRIRPDTLVPGCVPVVNLFRRIAEPVRVDQRSTAYPVIGDATQDRVTEVWQVTRVVGMRDDGERTEYVPLFSARHALSGEDADAFWFTKREATLREDRGGTDTWLSLTDLNFDPVRPAAETLMVHTLCTNRGLAEEVPAGADLSIEDAAPVAGISLLYKPTMPGYRGAAGETAWKLVSQMSLNHLSLTSGPDALEALQEILVLHTLDDPAARAQVAGLKGLEVRPIVKRIGADAWRGFCRGLEVTIDVDERAFVGASPLVFGDALARFLGLYVTVNSFVQLRFRSLQRGGGIWRTWPCITGAQHVL